MWRQALEYTQCIYSGVQTHAKHDIANYPTSYLSEIETKPLTRDFIILLIVPHKHTNPPRLTQTDPNKHL